MLLCGMVSMMGLQSMPMDRVSFHRALQLFGRYEALRHQGYRSSDALYWLLYYGGVTTNA